MLQLCKGNVVAVHLALRHFSNAHVVIVGVASLGRLLCTLLLLLALLLDFLIELICILRVQRISVRQVVPENGRRSDMRSHFQLRVIQQDWVHKAVGMVINQKVVGVLVIARPNENRQQ